MPFFYPFGFVHINFEYSQEGFIGEVVDCLMAYTGPVSVVADVTKLPTLAFVAQEGE
jgi:hypothetical protein